MRAKEVRVDSKMNSLDYLSPRPKTIGSYRTAKDSNGATQCRGDVLTRGSS